MPADPTRSSLLSRLRDTGDSESWREFEAQYRDLVIRFCRARGVQFADAEDVAQIVFASLARSLPRFVYDRARGRFRDYLFRCIRRAIQRRVGSAGAEGSGGTGRGCPGGASSLLVPDELDDAPAPVEAREAALWEREWMNHHYRLAVRSLRATSTEERSLEIFERSLAGATPRQIAAELGMDLEAVYKARQRVRTRVEATIARQIEEEDRVDAR